MMVVSTDQWLAEIDSFNCQSLCLLKCIWDNNRMLLRIIFIYFLLLCKVLSFKVFYETNVSLENNYYLAFIVSLFPIASSWRYWIQPWSKK